MLDKIKNFFLKLIPTKRRLIQLYAALLYNANIKGFINGNIFKGGSKALCVPGLNCYSCPGAIGACPLGSLQDSLAASKTKYPTYVLGIILLYAIIFGRTICGFLCPVGLLQELLYKIKTPKLKKSRVTRILSYFKYVLLVVLVVAIPLLYGLQENNVPVPGFCKYVCPAGTFEGAVFLLSHPNSNLFNALGPLFTWKFILLIIFVVASIFIFRFFCRFFCPLGAIYGIFNKLSILGVKVDKSKCTSCGACVNHCKMDVKEVGDHECINCGECRDVCPVNCIDWKVISNLVKEKQTDEEKLSTADSNKQPKRRYDRAFIVNLIMTIVLVVLLVVVVIYANFGGNKEPLKQGEICEDIKLNYHDKRFDIKKNSDATIWYFADDIDLKVLDELVAYKVDGLTIIVVSSYEHYADNIKQVEAYGDKVILAYDNPNNDAIESFVEKASYPYFVFLDKRDKVLISKNEIFNDNDYKLTIEPIVGSDVIIGNEVGNLCINQEINLIGSDEQFSVSNYRGKIVVINFWHIECGPCIKELQHFNQVAEMYADDVVMIAIHKADLYQADPNRVIQNINGRFPNYNILFGYDNLQSPYIEALGGLDSYPMTVIVNQEGIITYNVEGSVSEAQLISEISKLLPNE